jgi:transposase
MRQEAGASGVFYRRIMVVGARFTGASNVGVIEGFGNVCLRLLRIRTKNPKCEPIHMIDSTIVRAHACSAGYGQKSQAKQALGRSKGGFTTKIHARVDGLGYPLKMTLTGGQRHDITQAEPLTRELSDTTLIADRGYKSAVLIERLAKKKGCRVVMPPRKNSKVQRVYDRHIYKERHLVECFFGKIKHSRRVFSRFDKTAKVFLGFLHFVSVLIWLR